MKIFKKFCVNTHAVNLFEVMIMSKNNEKTFYAVGRGKKIGIYDSWKECKAQTEEFPNAKYRKFSTAEKAEEFVNYWSSYSSGIEKPFESEDLVSNISSRNGYAVNGRGNHYYRTDKEKFVKSISISHFSENKNNYILGGQNNKEGCNSESTLCVTPYTSPLLPTGSNFNKSKEFQNSLKTVTPLIPTVVVNTFNEEDLQRLNSSYSAGAVSSEIQHPRLRDLISNNSYKCSNNSNTNSSSLNPAFYVNNSKYKHFVIPSKNNALQSEPLNDSIKPNEPCLVIPDDGIGNIVKKEVVHDDCSDQNKKIKQNEYSESKEITGISENSNSCLRMLASALMAIINQNSSELGRLKNSLKSLLEEIFTNTNTNTNIDVNPQMEPEGNVDKICEETKNSEVQSVESTSNHQQPSSQKSYASLLSLSPHSTSFERGIGQKNVDVLALNLRLDSIEKRFDAFLKEIGAVTSEVSHLKAEVKELKEYFGSISNYGSNFGNTSSSWSSVSKKFTTSLESDYGIAKEKILKRRLSHADQSESFKRFEDDRREVDDLLCKIKAESIDYASFAVDEEDYVEVYTDGAAQSNGSSNAKAGIGIWFGDNHPMNVAEAVVGRPTNSMAEIQAARVAIQLAVKAGITKLKIYTDSEFLINCATKWIDRWKKNGWILSNGGPVKNRKELERLDKVASKIMIRWEKVAGHAGIKGNEMADRLANEGALKYSR